MLLPQYPFPENKPTEKGYYPKLPYLELMNIYDELTALGLYVVPKQYNKKLPKWEYWRKEGKITATRQLASQDQRHDSISGWNVVTGEQSNRLYVLDLDTAEIQKYGVDPVNIYDKIQTLSPNPFVLRSPANGLHLYYRIPEGVDMLTNAKPPVRGIDGRGNGGQVVSLGGWNRYDGTDAIKKGVADGHTETYQKCDYGVYTIVPDMDMALYEWLSTPQPKKEHVEHTKGENYGQTEAGRARIEKHMQQPLNDRETLTLECLYYTLNNWQNTADYELWYQMWMSAHHGSKGSLKVRDFILDHENIFWRDGDDGKKDFMQKWEAHEHKDEGGYTVSSMFYLARQAGWLSETGYEIPSGVVEHINVKYIGEWFDELKEIPKRLLLQSQTGSGKTFNISRVYRRLGDPKTVIFVPSIKLATELANTLRNEHNIMATLYRDEQTGVTKTKTELVQADFLVTTLQTFATKVYRSGTPMSDYGLVYIEESDQLLAQFARGGGGIYGSHVSEREARAGYEVIRDAMAESDYVWFVDATMSLVTYEVAHKLESKYTVQIIRNNYILQKPTVSFVEQKGQALQKALEYLYAGKRVVIACDTKTDAEESYSVFKQLGMFKDKKGILITRNTERQKSVIEFMTDVNKYAQEYDLVCYNSVMGSGVSITSTQPALLVQLCRYLTARTNLQMLNRYRNQKEVVCWYQNNEALYAKRATQVLDEAKERIRVESVQVNIPIAKRTDVADLRSYITSLAIADEILQHRSPRDFYKALLKMDGRKVYDASTIVVSGRLQYTLEGIKEVKKQRKDYIAETWREVKPVDNDRPPDPEYTDLQVAQGEVHAYLERLLKGNIPDEPNRFVYDITMEFRKRAFILSAYTSQVEALTKAETYLADKEKAITSLTNNITILKVVTLVHHIYQGDEEITPEIVALRAPVFMKHLTTERDAYDSVVKSRQKFAEVFDKHESVGKRATAFTKIILSLIGLKQRYMKQGRSGYYHIENLERAKTFLKWRNGQDEVPEILFTLVPIEDAILSRKEVMAIYSKMTLDKQDEVMVVLATDDNVRFEIAVMVVERGDTW